MLQASPLRFTLVSTRLSLGLLHEGTAAAGGAGPELWGPGCCRQQAMARPPSPIPCLCPDLGPQAIATSVPEQGQGRGELRENVGEPGGQRCIEGGSTGEGEVSSPPGGSRGFSEPHHLSSWGLCLPQDSPTWFPCDLAKHSSPEPASSREAGWGDESAQAQPASQTLSAAVSMGFPTHPTAVPVCCPPWSFPRRVTTAQVLLPKGNAPPAGPYSLSQPSTQTLSLAFAFLKVVTP